MKDTFLMIDGNSLLHRAFHALPLMDAGGVYTNAIYGFLTMMLKAIADENARYLAVCFGDPTAWIAAVLFLVPAFIFVYRRLLRMRREQ